MPLVFDVPSRWMRKGYDDVGDAVISAAYGVVKQLNAMATEMAPVWEQTAIHMLRIVVYSNPPGDRVPWSDSYYKRNYKLAEAIMSEVIPIQGTVGEVAVGTMGVDVVIRNDTARVQPTDPKGGAEAVEVPWQIEEGKYPIPWFGNMAPRPYMAATLAAINQRLAVHVDGAVARGLQEFLR